MFITRKPGAPPAVHILTMTYHRVSKIGHRQPIGGSKLQPMTGVKLLMAMRFKVLAKETLCNSGDHGPCVHQARDFDPPHCHFQLWTCCNHLNLGTAVTRMLDFHMPSWTILLATSVWSCRWRAESNTSPLALTCVVARLLTPPADDWTARRGTVVKMTVL